MRPGGQAGDAGQERGCRGWGCQPACLPDRLASLPPVAPSCLVALLLLLPPPFTGCLLDGRAGPTTAPQVGYNYFRLHPKGVGLVCTRAGGLPPLTFVEEYLGEIHTPWRWFEIQVSAAPAAAARSRPGGRGRRRGLG